VTRAACYWARCTRGFRVGAEVGAPAWVGEHGRAAFVAGAVVAVTPRIIVGAIGSRSELCRCFSGQYCRRLQH
jgi:hypothetical protein